jgi:hypothetical protein
LHNRRSAKTCQECLRFSEIGQGFKDNYFCVADALPSAVLSDNLMKVAEIKKFYELIWNPTGCCRTNRRS